MAGNLYAIVLGALVTVLALGFTWGDGAPGTVLRNRLAVGLMLLLPGTIALVFTESVLRCWFLLEELTRLSDAESKSKAAQRFIPFGRWAVMTGLAIVAASFTLFVVVQVNPMSVIR